MSNGRSQDELAAAVAALDRREARVARDLLSRLGSPAGRRLRAQIDQFQDRLGLAGVGNGGLTPIPALDADDDLARGLSEVLGWHPSLGAPREIAVATGIFQPDTADLDVGLLELGQQAIVAGVGGAISLGCTGVPDDRFVHAVFQIMVGADAVDTILRRVLHGHIDPLWDPTKDGVGPPLGGFADLDEIARKGCVQDIQSALGGFGKVVQGAKAAAAVLYQAHARGIQALVPSSGCAGDQVKIQGGPFGPSQPSNVSVYFPTLTGGCRNALVSSWTAAEVVVTAPQDVGVGYVGFVEAFGAQPATGQGEIGSASQLAGALEGCIGPAAAGVAQHLRTTSLAFGGRPVPCPQAAAGNVNRFTGGAPRIQKFEAAGGAKQVELKPGDTLSLSWAVTNATSIKIARVKTGGFRNQLPEITAPLVPASGTQVVPAIRGTYFWEGVYELQAFNSCAASKPVTARVHVTMRPPSTAFLWGVATSAYQVEGNITGNDWELFATDPTIGARVTAHGNVVSPPQNFNLAPAGAGLRHGSLTALQEDLDRAMTLGANAYRLSVEWSRVQPQPGPMIASVFDSYYVPVVRELARRGMKAVVTLNHLTLPLWVCTPPTTDKRVAPLAPVEADRADPGFQASLRGWENLQTIAAWLDFVDLAVRKLAPEGVHHWITLNEPVGSTVMVGYVAGVWPPGLSLDPFARAVYGNLLRAHVQAYDLIHSLDPKAQVSIAHNMTACKVSPGFDPFGANVAATSQVDYFYHWHFLDSVTSGSVDVNVDHRPKHRKHEDSNQFFGIPVADWMPKLDFVGVNYYRSFYVEHNALLSLAGLGYAGGQPHDNEGPSHLLTDLGWEVNPSGLYDILKRIQDEYGLPILITENGMSEIRDLNRAPHLVAHLDQLKRAIDDGVNVLGYLYWSLCDNWELDYNYEPRGRFGLYSVDRNQLGSGGVPLLLRRLTDGALAFQHFAASGPLSAASLARARERFGSLSAAGDHGLAPTQSNGALWDGKGATGVRLALYFARGNPSPAAGTAEWIGMVYDYASGRWVRLDDIVWDAATSQLVLYHRSAAGLPEREFVGTRAGDQISGTFTENGQSIPWSVERQWPHGYWTSGAPAAELASFAISASGKWEWAGVAPDPWQGKTFLSKASGMTERWDAWPVSVSGATINFPAGSTATLSLSGATMQGKTGTQTWVATRATDGVPWGA
jgi:beta-glucosidase